MLGVVLIHSDFSSNFADISPIGETVMLWGSKFVAGCCVPVFFILSGFLFFNNVDHFTGTVYLSKLRSRIRSLLIPYILWNIIAAAIFVFKVRVLGFPGYDIIVDNRINILNFIKGFWNVKDGYPFEFAFWFILRLMIFVVASPIAWIMAYNRKVIIAIFILLLIFNVNLYGMEYFALGAALARNGISGFHYNGKLIISLFFLMTLLMIPISDIEWAADRVQVIRNLLGAMVFLTCSGYLVRRGILDNKIGKSLVNSAFIIYAVHSLYPTVMRKFLAKIFGIDSTGGCLLTYFSTWILLIICSWLVYLILHRFFPKALKLLTGGRAS